MFVLACPHYYCVKFITFRRNQTCRSRAVCSIVCTIKKNTLTWDHIAMQNKMVRNVFLNNQFWNNMFHSLIIKVETIENKFGTLNLSSDVR